jgi:hypothetical protein
LPPGAEAKPAAETLANSAQGGQLWFDWLKAERPTSFADGPLFGHNAEMQTALTNVGCWGNEPTRLDAAEFDRSERAQFA